jgi:Fe-S-cluster containining protein
LISHTIRFSCTQCGKCCHDLRLPLAIDEAIEWLHDGGNVQVFCEAIPWPEEPPPDNLPAQYKRGRSFAAQSGDLPVRVAVTLVASFQGPCPNLQPDMRCGAYEKRPRVCRIYPAEVNPFVKLDPDNKACPPEAWSTGTTILIASDTVADPEVARTIAASRNADRQDAGAKAALCARLAISTAALANEGFVIHSPQRDALLNALRSVRQSVRQSAASGHSQGMAATPWRFVTNRTATRAALDEIGALALAAADTLPDATEYLGFHPAG